MYRQIRVNDTDADLQRILWRSDPSGPIEEFKLKTVTYGTACAPYLATRVLRQLALDESSKFPTAARIVLEDFYVDDLISGTDSIEEAYNLTSELNSLLYSGGFVLRKWCSNNAAVINGLPADNLESTSHLQLGQGDAIKTLGIRWHPKEDHFEFNADFTCSSQAPMTKRTIISEISKLYDPLGWLAPVVVIAKMFIQYLWTLGVSWDEEVPTSLRKEWTAYRQALGDVSKIHLPRYLGNSAGNVCDLHGFSDSSEKAYGAAVYLRVSNPSNTSTTVRLVCSKTRVAPLKQVSLPRLELCAAVLLAKLLRRTEQTLRVPINSITAWTDSTICLSWIKGEPRTWKTFVANRVSEIQQLIPPTDWKHVTSGDNPADVASRGSLPGDLINNGLWWNGPTWLTEPESCWPPSLVMDTSSDASLSERRTVKENEVSFINSASLSSETLVEKYSSLSKLKRVVAWCVRFCKNARLSKENRVTTALKPDELHNALMICIRQVQSEKFQDVIKSIVKGVAKHTNLASLNPFIDEQGVLRVGGRLRNLRASTDRRFPIILPKHHHLTQLIVKYEHERLLHAGPQATLASLRRTFWIVGGRDVVRHLIHKCHVCVRDRSNNLTQQMGDLPSCRVEISRPFEKCGVDYAGPFLIKPIHGRGRKSFKTYLALFVCTATKAVHLELVNDLTADSFIATLRRFVARRGHCKEIYSDNATNFIRANKELKHFLNTVLAQHKDSSFSSYLADQGIRWHFIPPRAPHFGGLWEAAIKSAKLHLRRVIGQATLSMEEMLTLITQIEACLNSRPLTPMSSDPNDLEVLTPGHFLIGAPLVSLPDPSYVSEIPANRLGRWELVQRMHQHFWKRWNQEYLVQLQQRPKWRHKVKDIKIGDLVILKEDNIPPHCWAKGRVIGTHSGRDGCVRVVDVRTARGVIKRALNKLCILPSEAD